MRKNSGDQSETIGRLHVVGFGQFCKFTAPLMSILHRLHEFTVRLCNTPFSFFLTPSSKLPRPPFGFTARALQRLHYEMVGPNFFRSLSALRLGVKTALINVSSSWSSVTRSDGVSIHLATWLQLGVTARLGRARSCPQRLPVNW